MSDEKAAPAPAEGWLGVPCSKCSGTGESEAKYGRRACPDCGGTGEAYGKKTTETRP